MKKSVKNLIALILGIFFGIILLESLLRIYNPFPATVKGNRIMLRANAKTTLKTDGNPKMPAEIYVSTNSLGFRGPEPPKDFEKFLTIIAVGGSTTHSYYTSDDKTWAFLLGQRLKSKYQNVWVGNAGLSGHSTYGHIILMEDYIIKLRPKIVLFLVGINEVARVIPDEFGLVYNDDGKNMLIKKIKSTLLRSELVGLLITISRVIKAKELKLAYDTAFNLNKVNHISIPEKEKIRQIELHRTQYLQLYEKRVLTLVKLCRDNGVDPILITQPALYGDTTDPTTGINLGTIQLDNNINGGLQWTILELYNDVTREIGRKTNSMVIDLAHFLPKDSKFFSDLLHFTEEGNRKISEILYSELAKYLDKANVTLVSPHSAPR